MKFHDGLNVIIGSNNSGKTGLLNAINLINHTDRISIDDFIKNRLLKICCLFYGDIYKGNEKISN